MKHLRSLAFFVCSIGLAGATVWSSLAVAQTAPSSPPLHLIRSQCQSIRSTLQRIQHNDALLRVNAGQAYNTISTNLIAKLNSRLALAQVDSSRMVMIARDYEEARKAFAQQYNEYESNLTALVRTDCTDKPGEFYAQLIKTHDARRQVSESVTTMSKLAADYRVAVEQLKVKLSGGGGRG
jgi:hypothetical protein